MFGDHAAFIIPAYAITAIVLIWLSVQSRIQYNALRKELKILEDSGLGRRAKNPATIKAPK
ncbi:MAG: heme exporter protein CcmD [Rhizobiaceae bacterium]|nr:heme exporter protein CcmD [Rhizobiaceae bacterium]